MNHYLTEFYCKQSRCPRRRRRRVNAIFIASNERPAADSRFLLQIGIISGANTIFFENEAISPPPGAALTRILFDESPRRRRRRSSIFYWPMNHYFRRRRRHYGKSDVSPAAGQLTRFFLKMKPMNHIPAAEGGGVNANFIANKANESLLQIIKDHLRLCLAPDESIPAAEGGGVKAILIANTDE